MPISLDRCFEYKVVNLLDISRLAIELNEYGQVGWQFCCFAKYDASSGSTTSTRTPNSHSATIILMREIYAKVRKSDGKF